MSLLDALRHRLRALVRPFTYERELDDEMRFHLSLEEMEQRQQSGAETARLSADEARFRARRRFGNVTYFKEETRNMTDLATFDAVRQDFRDARRSLARSPGLTTVVALTLALGIGANAVMFSVVDRLLLRPPAHVRDASTLVRLYRNIDVPNMGAFIVSDFSFAAYGELAHGTRAFVGVAGSSPSPMSLGSGTGAVQVSARTVTGNFFALLGVRPAIGRLLSDADDSPTARATVVLGDGIWRRQFGASPAVLGAMLRIDRGRYTVIGVAPRGFTGTDLRPVDVWLPMSAVQATTDPAGGWRTVRNTSWIDLVARLAPGTGMASASRDAGAVYAAGNAQADPHARIVLAPLIAGRGPQRAPEVTIAVWLAGMSIVVLLVACANVANLLLARAMQRRREIAVRLALGVSRGRLARQLVGESVTLGALGATAALVLARWVGAPLRSALLPEIDWSDASGDGRVLVLGVIVALAVGLLTGIAPLAFAWRADVANALKSGVREGGGRRSRAQACISVMQAALCALLLVGAGLFVHSFQRAASVNLGFDPARLLVARLDATGNDDTSGASSATGRAHSAFFDRALAQVEAIPVVEHATLAVTMPYLSRQYRRIRVPGLDSVPGFQYANAVGPDYFATMGLAIVRGRALTTGDREGAPRVAVVNDEMARRVWPGRDPIGRCFQIGHDSAAPCVQVVGVARTIRWYSLREEPAMQFYVPLAQRDPGAAHPLLIGDPVLLIRTRDDAPARYSIEIKRRLHELSRNLPYVDVLPAVGLLDGELRPWRLGAMVFSAFGIVALCVAALGLYSVLAYDVAQRRHELGVRLALGADAATLARLFLADGLRLALLGLGLGFAVALALGRTAAPLLFSTSPANPAVYAAVAAVLLTTAALAGLVPSWRAAHLEPAAVLRGE